MSVLCPWPTCRLYLKFFGIMYFAVGAGASHYRGSTEGKVRDWPAPAWLKRREADEDENKHLIKKIVSQSRRNRARQFLSSCLRLESPFSSPPAPQALPEERQFRWMIASHHVPEEYQSPALRSQSPWYMLLRCLFIDLHGQLKNDTGARSWRDYPVRGSDEFENRSWAYDGPLNLKCGRRTVFSEQNQDEYRSLSGRWLIIAYTWADNRTWLENVDVRNLVSFSGAI